MNVAKPVLATAAVVAAMAAASAWAWPHAAALTPVHWNVDGVADRFGSRTETLSAMPAVAMGVGALFAVLPRLAPSGGRLERSGRAYVATWAAILAMLAVVHAGLVASALGAAPDMVRLVALAAGALFLVMGNYLGKVRYNYMVGLRLPWTLADERVWDRTHRFAGPLMMLGGGVLALLALVAPSGAEGARWLTSAMLACTLGPLLAAAVYSWRLSRGLAA